MITIKKYSTGISDRITRIDPEEQEVTVDFDGRQVDYDFSDLNELVLAYAVSVHKSQGSEYPVVVMPVHISHYMLLQRNLIYTGVTRARKLVIMVGTKKPLSIGLRNNKIQRRFTGLSNKLMEDHRNGADSNRVSPTELMP
jgi:exodeoxyribonuclease V alpha subunit